MSDGNMIPHSVIDRDQVKKIKGINLRKIVDLYRTYSEELKQVRESQKELYSIGFLPQLNDEEAEITYLLIRETKPEIVVEVSPCRGWSTTWILQGLKANGKGICYSYELKDDNIRWAKKNIPQYLASRWRCFKGRVQHMVEEFPSEIPYLFIDSEHTRSFARWYIEKLFPRVNGIVSIHDVFHIGLWGEASEEGKEVIDYLDDHQIDFFSCSIPFLYEYRKVQDLRRSIGLGRPIHARACGCARLFGCLAAVVTPELRPSNLPKVIVDEIKHIFSNDLDELRCNPAMFFSLRQTKA